MADAKPILFSAALIPKILDGSKTQTRRPMKPQPERIPEADRAICGSGWWWACNAVQSMVRLNETALPYLSPYGNPGGHDPGRLWVRETHAIVPATAYAGSTDDGVNPLPHRVSPDGLHWAVYRAGWTRCKPGPWRPSIHMPRWASRITLEVTEVRAQRLRDIDCYDIRAEGFECPEHDFPGGFCTSECSALRAAFYAAWDAMYSGKPELQSEANPWLWALSFKVVP
jgi:hypothetical protein